MALPSWPLALPQDPQRADYSLTPVDELLRSDMDVGADRSRRRFTHPLYRLHFNMIMEQTQFLLFKGFFFSTLRHGTLQFNMLLYRGNDFITTRCRFEAPYQANDFAAIEMINVTFTLIAFDLIT